MTTPVPVLSNRPRTRSVPRRPFVPQRQNVQQREPARNNINVGDAERWASVIGGTALALVGLERRSLGGLALGLLGGCLVYRGATGQCQMYQALGINMATPARGPGISLPVQTGVMVEKSMTINKPAAELYRFWRDFSNLPRFMRHLEAVTTTGAKTSHWVAKGPVGATLSWDAEIINEKENELIAWRSLDNADVANTGSVRFQRAPDDRGTEVRVTLKYDPPAGKVGAALAKLLGQSPDQQIEEDLHRFKQIMETGEISTTQGQPSGRSR